MTPDEIRERIDKIRRMADDDADERAHSDEDVLHQDVLSAIADGTLCGDGAREAAALALTTRDVTFSRWCA